MSDAVSATTSAQYSPEQIVEDLGHAAKKASRQLSQVSEETINQVLKALAEKLRTNVPAILEANKKDLAAGEQRRPEQPTDQAKPGQSAAKLQFRRRRPKGRGVPRLDPRQYRQMPEQPGIVTNDQRGLFGHERRDARAFGAQLVGQRPCANGLNVNDFAKKDAALCARLLALACRRQLGAIGRAAHAPACRCFVATSVTDVVWTILMKHFWRLFCRL